MNKEETLVKFLLDILWEYDFSKFEGLKVKIEVLPNGSLNIDILDETRELKWK